MRLSTAKAPVIVAAGATAFATVKFGIEGRLPTFGPVTPPIAAIILGALIVMLRPLDGDAGDLLEGVGLGLVAAGAITLGG